MSSQLFPKYVSYIYAHNLANLQGEGTGQRPVMSVNHPVFSTGRFSLDITGHFFTRHDWTFLNIIKNSIIQLKIIICEIYLNFSIYNVE